MLVVPDFAAHHSWQPAAAADEAIVLALAVVHTMSDCYSCPSGVD